MSFAIIQTGGKQYKVKAGEIIKIEKFGDQKPNSIIEFKEILAYGDDKNIEVGLPTVQGAKVEAEFLKNAKNLLHFQKSNYGWPSIIFLLYTISQCGRAC